MSENRHPDTQNNADLLDNISALRADIKKAITRAMEQTPAKNEEQFLAEVMAQNCPRCNRNQIKDCRKVEGINDITVGLCMQCGHLWCLECGGALLGDSTCGHWRICLQCDIVYECNIDMQECNKLKDNNGRDDRNIL